MHKTLISLLLSFLLCNSLDSALHIILIGPPGSGKGTFVNLMSSISSFEQVNPGDLLRKEVKAQTDLGLQIQSRVAKGELVTNDIVWELVNQKLVKILSEKRPFILDAFPISEENFLSLHAFIQNHPEEQFIFLRLVAAEEVCVQRICSRRTCSECGEVFNDITRIPKISNSCDRCAAPLTKRSDDILEHAVKRVENINQKIKRVVNCIQSHGFTVTEIDTNCSLSECHRKYTTLGIHDDHHPGRNF